MLKCFLLSKSCDYLRSKQLCQFWIIFLEFSLAICDCLLIIDAIVQRSIIPYFTGISPNEPDWFIMMYPYFWYPFRGIIVTVTIYMMLAISAERFRAVCYPLSKRHVSKSDTEDKFFGLLDIFSCLLFKKWIIAIFSVTMQIRFGSIGYFSAVKVSEILPI